MSDYQGPQGGWTGPAGPPTGGSTPPPPPPPPPSGSPWTPGGAAPVGPGGTPPTQVSVGPAYPPPPQGATGPNYVPPKPKGGKGKIVLAAVAAVAVLGAGAFAAVQLTGGGSASGGSDTPDDAVDAMLTALEENDVVGMIDHLAPGEREVFKDSINDYVTELKRLGVLSEDADLENVPGFSVAFDGMQYDVEERNDRVSLVTVTAGQVTASTQIADLPLGDVILDQVGDELPADEPEQTVDIAEAMAEGGEPLRIGVIEEDGSWYVSAFYTAAELAAEQSGHELPSEPIAAAGADSPEAAVTEMLDAAVNADVERVIELTPPDEMAALHDYGQILVDLAADAQAEAGTPTIGSGLSVTVDEYELETTDVTGGTKVLPTHLKVSVTEDESGEVITVEGTKVDDTCVEWRVSGTADDETVEESGTSCSEDILQLFENSDVPVEVQDIAVRMVEQVGQLGIVTVEVDGEWYVSPLRTYNDVFIVALQGLEPGDLEALIDFAAQGG